MPELMLGRVSPGAQVASLMVVVSGPSGRREIKAVLDTGLTGALCLGEQEIEDLRLPLVGRGAAVLADGRAVETRYHRGTVSWHGRERGVQVLSAEGGPLVGMTLLRGSRLTVDAMPRGDVRIEELPDGRPPERPTHETPPGG